MTGAVVRATVPTGTCVLDHVAVRVADRDAVAAELVGALDVRVIERTERLTLLGPDFGAGKITLLDAPADSTPVPGRIISLVLAAGTGHAADAPLVLACGLVLTFQGSGSDDERSTDAPRHSLVGIALRSDDPPITGTLLAAEYGMHIETGSSDTVTLVCGDAGSGATSGGLITLVRERVRSAADEAPMLDHIGLRVDDASAWHEYAERADLSIDHWVDAAHSRATFLNAPDGLLIEYVEQTAAMGDA